MVDGIWQPMLYMLGRGFIGGLVVGFAARKLNKVIATLLGATILALNVLWFARMLGGDTGFQLLRQLADAVFGLIPFSWAEVQRELEPVLMVSAQVPFIAGFLIGLASGFKLA